MSSVIVFCPECKERGLKSRCFYKRLVSPDELDQTGRTSYWDEDGNQHIHDSRTIVSSYVCSEGHTFTIKSKWGCLQPDCRWPYENGENVRVRLLSSK